MERYLRIKLMQDGYLSQKLATRCNSRGISFLEAGYAVRGIELIQEGYLS